MARSKGMRLAAACTSPGVCARRTRYRPHSSRPLWDRRPASFYVDPGLPDLFTKPYRPNMVNLAGPETYSDIWGDWYGVFAWDRETHVSPSPARNGWLVFQNVLGLLPTNGIPLPLISYGGSSLFLTLASIGVLLNITQHTD